MRYNQPVCRIISGLEWKKDRLWCKSFSSVKQQNIQMRSKIAINPFNLFKTQTRWSWLEKSHLILSISQIRSACSHDMLELQYKLKNELWYCFSKHFKSAVSTGVSNTISFSNWLSVLNGFGPSWRNTLSKIPGSSTKHMCCLIKADTKFTLVY